MNQIVDQRGQADGGIGYSIHHRRAFAKATLPSPQSPVPSPAPANG
jgi:hypothetical protein